MNKLVNLIIGADGRRLDSGLKAAEKSMSGFGKKVDSIGSRIGGGLKKALVNPIAGFVSAGAIAYASKQIIDFDSDLTRLAINGNMTAEAQMKLREEIVNTGIASGQTRTDVLAGLDAIVQRTGDLQFSQAVMKDMAIASTATGTSMADLGAVASNLSQKFKLSGDEIKTAFNILAVQGKAGAFTLKDMGANFERITASAQRLGMTGLEDLSKLGAFIQIARMGTGSSDQATTAVERTLGSILEKQDEIKEKAQFSIFSNESTKELKSFDEIIKGVIKGTGGDEKVLGELFGAEGIRAVSVIASAYRETKGFDLYDKLVAADDPGAIMKDFARYSTTAAHQMNVLKGVFTEFADSALSPIIGSLTKKMKELTDNPEEFAKLRDQFKDIGGNIALAGDLIITMTDNLNKMIPTLEIVANTLDSIAWVNPFTETEDERLTNQAKVEIKQLPKSIQKQIRQNVDGKSLETGLYGNLEKWKQGQLPGQPKTEINMSINIDDQGRVISQVDDHNTAVKTRYNRGPIMAMY